MNKKPWTKNWKVIKSFSGGGQGATLFVHKIGNEDQVFVMKLLNNQKDSERRKRMRIEVLTNEAIDHSGVPKIIDSNADDYKDSAIKLFCVLEYIEGGTLSENLKGKPISLEDAVKLILELIEIVNYCHTLGIVHRDIKPDNIILNDSNYSRPYLIDFGLTFNENIEINDDKPTSANQHLGNRFLLLPELRGGESNKRDFRSDITSLIGILFYVLTAEHPTNLTDENSSKPHQRTGPKEKLSVIESEKLTKLNRIFDQGFNVSINDRYQTLSSLKIDLNELINVHQSPENIEDKLSAIRKLTTNDKYKSTSRLDTTTNEISKQLKTIINSIASQFSDFSQYQTGYNIDYIKNEHQIIYGYKYKFDQLKEAKLNFKLYTNGSEEIFEVLIGSQTTELARRPFSGIFNWISIKDKIRNLVIDEIYRKSN